MELNGEVLIDAPRPQVWRALNDPAVLARCIPGCEEVRQLSDAETHVRVALKMGPVRARFVGKILMGDVVEDQGCTLNFEGSGGAAGFARGQSKVALTDRGTATCLTYSASAAIGGKLGQVGGRMIDASAKQMADQFFNKLQADFLTPTESPQQPSESEVPAAATSAVARPAVRPHPTTVSVPPAASALPTSESVRVLWFALGAAATGFGVMLARLF